MPNEYNTGGFSRQFGEWRYFNSALEKLGGYRPSMLSLNVPSKFRDDKELNWMTVLGESFKLTLGGLEARQKYVNKQVDSWLRSHSLEEYKQAVVSNNLPFQDDPLAMNRLKYDHGKIAFQLAERDFQNRVDRNEFVGMAPEQVDAEHFNHVRGTLKELNGTFPWATEDDYWFKKGFYEDSEGGRIKVLVSQQKVANDWNVQEGIMQDSALINAVSTDLKSDPLAIVATVKDVFANPKVAHYSPEQKQALIKNVLPNITKRPNGGKILDDLADLKVFDGSDLTLKDVVGDVEWYKAHVESDKNAWIMDADAYAQDVLSIDDHTAQGDVAWVMRELEAEEATSGNRRTARYEYLLRAVGSAKRQAEVLKRRAEADAKSEMGKFVKDRDAGFYLDSLASGAETKPNNILDLDQTSIDKKFWERVESGQYSLSDIVNIAKNPTGKYNPARGYFRARAESCLAIIEGQAQALLNNKATVLSKPKYLDDIASAFAMDSAAVDEMMGDVPDWQKETLVTLINAQSTGLTYQDIIRSNANYITLNSSSEGRKKLQRINERYDAELDEMEGKGEIKGDSYSRSYIKTKALAYTYNGLTNSDALEKARSEFNNNHYNVKGAAVPISFFRVTNNTNLEDAQEFFEHAVDNFAKENKDRSFVYGYNPYLKSYDITDADTAVLVKRITNKDLATSYMKFVENKASETPTTIIHDILNMFK